MEKAKKLFNAIIILFVSTFITTSCSENNKNKEQKSLDTEANLFGKWEYEEMGIKMNIEILENILEYFNVLGVPIYTNLIILKSLRRFLKKNESIDENKKNEIFLGCFLDTKEGHWVYFWKSH